MGNIGSECLRLLNNPKVHQQRMLACLRLMKKIFISQLITLAIEGALVGYYLANTFLIFKNEFESEEYISPLCSMCNENNFQIICKKCRTILGCEDCFKKEGLKTCPKCDCDMKSENIIKIFMN